MEVTRGSCSSLDAPARSVLTVRLHADFNLPVVERPDSARWVASPVAGVTRRMLDRIGDEVARATSVVRYAPDSHFTEHVHGGGEEILVLEGVFGDEHGDYPAGAYLRNPRGTRHAPYTAPGSLLFVKLHQFAEDDDRQCAVDTDSLPWRSAEVAGIEYRELHVHGRERVCLERWRAGLQVTRTAPAGGEELYLLAGSLTDARGDYAAGTWLRDPPGTTRTWTSGDGVTLYRKTGHLPV